MKAPAARRTTLEVSWRTVAKLLAAVALVWVWLQLWQLLLLVVHAQAVGRHVRFDRAVTVRSHRAAE